MDSIIKLSGEQLTVLSSVIAVAISEGLSISDQNVLGNFIAAVGASLLTIAAQNEAMSKKTEVKPEGAAPKTEGNGKSEGKTGDVRLCDN